MNGPGRFPAHRIPLQRRTVRRCRTGDRSISLHVFPSLFSQLPVLNRHLHGKAGEYSSLPFVLIGRSCSPLVCPASDVLPAGIPLRSDQGCRLNGYPGHRQSVLRGGPGHVVDCRLSPKSPPESSLHHAKDHPNESDFGGTVSMRQWRRFSPSPGL